MQFMLNIMHGNGVDAVVGCNSLLGTRVVVYGAHLFGCGAILSSSPVRSLFFGRCPTAVARLIVAVFVRPTVDTSIWRRFAHIGEKVCEDVPAFAYAYAAPAIVGVIFDVGVVTAGKHVTPNSVCFSAKPSARVPMDCSRNVSLSIFRGYFFFVVTAARQCALFAQAIGPNAYLSATIATAQPFSFNRILRYVAPEDKQAAKSLTSDINKGGHGDLRERLRVKWRGWCWTHRPRCEF